MKGKYRIVVNNKRLHYEFEIKRNITVIQGDSATGKTTLINMLRQAESLGSSSGVDVVCPIPCRVLEGASWKLILEHTTGTIFFADEENSFINTQEFAEAVRNSDNYYVLITRENLYNLPYSVEEIYGLHCSGKYHDTRKMYQQMYQIYSGYQSLPVVPERVITEDSNSGFDFFKAVCEERKIPCESAGGKSNLLRLLDHAGKEAVCMIADGAAIGPEMNRLSTYALKSQNIHLYFPESFEWLILKSGLIQGHDIPAMLEHPEDYADSTEFFSWERFFTRLLTEATKDSYLQYSKAQLNKVYLHNRNKQAILDCIEGINF